MKQCCPAGRSGLFKEVKITGLGNREIGWPNAQILTSPGVSLRYALLEGQDSDSGGCLRRHRKSRSRTSDPPRPAPWL